MRSPATGGSPSGIRRIGIQLVVAGVSVAMGLGLAEVGLRLVAPRKTMFPRYVPSHDYEIEMAPNAVIHQAQGSRWSFTYSTNRMGRRGPWTPPDSVGHRSVAVALGDSFTFGIGVGDGQVWAEKLDGLLGPDWVVVNGGMSGWGIDSEIKWYHREAAVYRPRVVILQFTTNDPWESRTGVTTLEEGRLRFHPYGGEKPGWQAWLSRSGLVQRSHLYSLLRSALAAAGSAGQDPPDPDAAARARREAGEHYAALLRAFALRLASEGPRLVFFSVTGRRDGVYGYDLRDFPSIQAEVERLRDQGLLTLVELPLEAMARFPGSPEGHQWAAEHHGLVAEAVAAVLRDETPAPQRAPGR